MSRFYIVLVLILVSYSIAQPSFRDAVSEGTADDVMFWLDQGADVNSFGDDSKTTPLELAARINPDPSIVTLLIKKGAHINDTDEYHSPLIAAIEYHPKPEVVKALLDSGVPVDVNGKSVLTLAVSQPPNEDTRIIQWLLEAGADPNLPGLVNWGLEMPLHAAIARNCFSFVSTLLKAGANPNLIDKVNGGYPIHMFVARDRLVDGRAYNRNPCPNDPSLQETLEIFLSYGMNINQPSVRGNTPIMIAARDWEPDVLNVLLEAGADPNLVNDCGNTALLHALIAAQDSLFVWNPEDLNQYKYTVIQRLIDKGVNVNARYQGCSLTSEPWSPKLLDTALILAVRFADMPSIQLLLNAGAEVNAQNASGETALLVATQLSQKSTLETYTTYLKTQCENCYFDRGEQDKNFNARKTKFYEIIVILIGIVA